MRQSTIHSSFFQTSRLICLLFLLGTAALHAQTITFEMRNGDRITGFVLNENTNRVAISNAWSKEFMVPLAEIKSRQTNAPVVAVTPAPPVAKTNAPTVAAAKPAPAPVAVVKPAAAVKPKGFKDWHGTAEIGADVGLGETTRELYHAGFKITYTPAPDSGPGGGPRIIDRFRNTFDYNAAYGTVTADTQVGGKTKSVTSLSANRMDGSSKTDFDLGSTRKAFVYNLLGAGYDEIRRIDLRYEAGPGMGYHLFQRTNFVMNTEAGMSYQAQYFQNQTETEKAYFRFAEDLTWKISKLLTFDEKFEIFPEVNFDQYRLRFESNLRYWFLENLSFNLTVLNTYDTQVAPGIDKNDLQIRSSVGVKF